MKKFASAVLSAALLMTAAACAPAPADSTNGGGAEVEISLWTYPVGEWGNANSVAPLIAAFRRAHPEIAVTLKTLDYTNGDKEIAEAVSSGTLPDLILEGPERIVVDYWGTDLMVSLNDLWEGEEMKSVQENVEKASKKNGTYYFYPICMTTHCMAINRDVFEATDAWKYINKETHTWTTQQFESAVAAIKEYYDREGIEHPVAAIYCKENGGDQGTRALVNNLCGGTFADGTKYTVDSPENIEALQRLYKMQAREMIKFDDTMNGADERNAFCRGELAMSFCWNVAAEVNQSIAHPDITSSVFPMAFPAKEGSDPSLQGGIWGFGAFNSGDEKRIAAAKEFIRFIGEEDYTRAVTVSSYLPVRKLDFDPYENDALMNEYSIFSQYLGAYYQITPNWAQARGKWRELLQAVGRGENIETAIHGFPVLT